jgi:hypothetical protein
MNKSKGCGIGTVMGALKRAISRAKSSSDTLLSSFSADAGGHHDVGGSRASNSATAADHSPLHFLLVRRRQASMIQPGINQGYAQPQVP